MGNVIDPLAKKYQSFSPYEYCANNSVNFVDPNGMDFVEGREYYDQFRDETLKNIKSSTEKP